MSDDFKIVRGGLYAHKGEAEAALDRIEARLREAEAQRDAAWIESALHEHLDEANERIHELEAESERLRKRLGGGMVSTSSEDPKRDR
jgi:regulator of replication initiation timing